MNFGFYSVSLPHKLTHPSSDDGIPELRSDFFGGRGALLIL